MLARKRDRMWNVTGFRAAHDQSEPPVDHSIPYFANLLIVRITRQNDPAFDPALKTLDCLLGETDFSLRFSVLSTGIDVGL
jgi:hypothetical protein